VSLRRYIKVAPRLPPLNRKTILMRDIGVCQYCSKIAENIDHIIPRSKGGGTTWENCVAACKNCNSRKGANYLKDMPGMKLKKQPGPPSALSWVHAAVWKVHFLSCQAQVHFFQCNKSCESMKARWARGKPRGLGARRQGPAAAACHPNSGIVRDSIPEDFCAVLWFWGIHDTFFWLLPVLCPVLDLVPVDKNTFF